MAVSSNYGQHVSCCNIESRVKLPHAASHLCLRQLLPQPCHGCSLLFKLLLLLLRCGRGSSGCLGSRQTGRT